MAVAHGGQTLLTDGVRDASGVVVTDLGTHTAAGHRDAGPPEPARRPTSSRRCGASGRASCRSPRPGPRWSAGTRRSSTSASSSPPTGWSPSPAWAAAARPGWPSRSPTGRFPSHPQGVWFVDLSTIADEAALPGAFATALRLSVDAGDGPARPGRHLPRPPGGAARGRQLRARHRRGGRRDRPPARAVPGPADRRHQPRVPRGRRRVHLEGAVARRPATGRPGGPALRRPGRRRRCRASDDDRDHGGDPRRSSSASTGSRSPSSWPRPGPGACRSTEIRDLLDDRFSLLSGGSRRSRQRQATLEGAVQWSYDLLSEDEQALLRTLSVFQGGFAAPDVAVVAQVSELNTRKLIDALAAKSLVDVTRDASGEVRHRLLETIRLFALARLVDAGEAVETRDRHLDHFADRWQRPTSSPWWNDLDRGDPVRVGSTRTSARPSPGPSSATGSRCAVRMAAMGTEAAGPGARSSWPSTSSASGRHSGPTIRAMASIQTQSSAGRSPPRETCRRTRGGRAGAGHRRRPPRRLPDLAHSR